MYELKRKTLGCMVDQIYNQQNYIGLKSIGTRSTVSWMGKSMPGMCGWLRRNLAWSGISLEGKGIKTLYFRYRARRKRILYDLKKNEAEKGEFEISKLRSQLVEWMD